MHITTTPPETGQFVAIYSFNNITWAKTLRWDKGFLEAYDAFADNWTRILKDILHSEIYDRLHFIVF